ncbi:response regulator [Endomicrobium sp. AH-315-J14]|nr:response regulator [Endomicrobium sp. AH-315-J14]
MLGTFELTEEQISESRIVVVDDEELITNTLSNFLFVELEVDPITFNDPVKALAYIQKEPIDLIISDFLMPQLDGIQLLAGARDAAPHAPRILLTGYADKENAIKAINAVQLYQYVEKPWDNGQFKNIIVNGLQRKHLIGYLSNAIEKLTSTEQDLAKLRKGLMRAFA